MVKLVTTSMNACLYPEEVGHTDFTD